MGLLQLQRVGLPHVAMGADLAATQMLLELKHGHPHNGSQVQLDLQHQQCAAMRDSGRCPRILSPAGLAWEWMDDWLKGAQSH